MVNINMISDDTQNLQETVLKFTDQLVSTIRLNCQLVAVCHSNISQDRLSIMG